MMNMTVAMIDAAVTMSAFMKARIATGRASQRVKTESGMKNMRRKERHVPVRKRPNIRCEIWRMRSRISLISAGRLTVRY